MKGIFSKIMNKLNELPNPQGPKTSSQNQKQDNKNQISPQSPQNNVFPSESMPTPNRDNNQQNNNNINTINNDNNVNKNKPDGQIVIVNERQPETKLKGYYYQKHIEDIRKLKVSEPIIYQRQKMKVNFDIDILDYLFNDMTEIFKHKSDVVEANKNELIKKINETYDLVNILSELNKNSDECLNKYIKQKKIMDNVEMLEIFIKSLSQEVDDLLTDITKFEQKMKDEEKAQETQNK